MKYLANVQFFEDLDIATLMVFVFIGFFAGFFFKLSSKNGKKRFLSLEDDALANRKRIAELKEKLELLEKENRALGRANSVS